MLLAGFAEATAAPPLNASVRRHFFTPMRVSAFSAAAESIVGPQLYLAGFAHHERCVYTRELPSGIRWSVAFDLAKREAASFRVYLSVNAAPYDDAASGHFVRYFTGGSISEFPRNLPCHSQNAARQQLQRFASTVEPLILPFFRRFSDLPTLAKALPDSDLDFYRGQLYLHAGLLEEARDELLKYKARVAFTCPSEQDLLRAVHDADVLLRRIGGA